VKVAAVLFALVLSPLALRSAEAEWFVPHGYYTCDFATDYISRGKVVEDRPIQINEAAVRFPLGQFGSIGAYHWNYSNLTGDFQGSHRRFIPETDWGVTYEYDWQFAADWRLDTELMAYWETYYGGRPRNDPSEFEWRVKQTLKNPYLTPYYKFRRVLRPVDYTYFQVGLKRSFELAYNPVNGLYDAAPRHTGLTVNVFSDLGNSRCIRKRCGRLPNGESYSDGIVALSAEVTLDVPITDSLSFHATVGQLEVVNEEGRDNLSPPQHADRTYGLLGLTIEF